MGKCISKECCLSGFNDKRKEILIEINNLEDQKKEVLRERDNSHDLKKERMEKISLEFSQAGISIQKIIEQLNLQESLLDRKQDSAWLNKSNDPKFRGKLNFEQKEYFQPIGYYGIGLSVLKIGDNDWLNSEDSENTWIVLYHKTRPEFVLPILKEGFKAGSGQNYQSSQCILGRGIVGVGIYFADVIEHTQDYGSNLEINNHEIQIIIQCRVNPKSVKRVNQNIFVVANASDIRPYRILIKKA